MNQRRIIALLGRQDTPTDAVEEYCRYLGAALHERGYSMEVERVPWPERGWNTAIRELGDKTRAWRGGWVLAQYTALAWSARGFPLRFPRVLRELRNGGARVGIVFHDVEPYSGLRPIDKVRRRAQSGVMRQTLNAAAQGVFTVPLDAITWLAPVPPNATFIPVGANLPVSGDAPTKVTGLEPSVLSVAVFGITEGATGQQECKEIVEALRFVSGKGKVLRLHAFGRGAREFESQLRDALRDARVQVCVEGVLPGEQVVQALTAADVALFVRAPISTRRGSAIAGIACGLPVIAYAGPETVPPITEAGVVLVSREKKAELGQALLRVASDADLRASLAERSRTAYKEHFAWNAIAGRFIQVLNQGS